VFVYSHRRYLVEDNYETLLIITVPTHSEGTNSQLPLQELWIEDIWSLTIESHFTSYGALRSRHLNWRLLARAVPYAPPGLLYISITPARSEADNAPDCHRLKAQILLVDISKLKLIRVIGPRGYPLLIDEMELHRNLGLRGLLSPTFSRSSIMGAGIVGDTMAGVALYVTQHTHCWAELQLRKLCSERANKKKGDYSSSAHVYRSQG